MRILGKAQSRTEENIEQLKAMVHGLSGSGKSTMAGKMPGHVLYAWTERQGAVSFRRVNKDGQTLQIASLSDLRGLLLDLSEAKVDPKAGTVAGFHSLVLDSGTEMQRLILEDVMGADRLTASDSVSIKKWGIIIDKTMAMIRAFRDLPMHVLITFLSSETFLGEGDGARRIVRPQVSGRTLPQDLSQFFNVVGYAFKRKISDDVRYSVLLEGREDFQTKSMPGLRYVEDPDPEYWFNRAIKGCQPRDPDAQMCPYPFENPEKKQQVEESKQ